MQPRAILEGKIESKQTNTFGHAASKFGIPIKYNTTLVAHGGEGKAHMERGSHRRCTSYKRGTCVTHLQ